MILKLKFSAVLIMLVMMNTWNVTHAQNDVQKYKVYLQLVSDKVNKPILTYRYKVLMVNNTTHKATDSINGLLSKVNRSNFLDSNSSSVSLLSNGYFFKADSRKRSVLFFKMSSVEKKLGLKEEDMNTNLINLPDSILSKVGNFKTQEINGDLLLTYSLKKSAGSIRDLVFRFNKKDMLLLEIKMIVDETDPHGGASGFSRIYVFKDFNNEPATWHFASKNYYSLQDNKVTLANHYKNYKLSSIL